MIAFLTAAVPLLLLFLGIVQFSLLWAGKSAVDTAAHIAARKFARCARDDIRAAHRSAFLEAARVCRIRPGGSIGSAAMTTLEWTNAAGRKADRVKSGDAVCLRLSHGVELIVPWIDRVLYLLSPGRKVRVGDRYYLMLQATRWVTVE